MLLSQNERFSGEAAVYGKSAPGTKKSLYRMKFILALRS
jgi:hypothetical protein